MMLAVALPVITDVSSCGGPFLWGKTGPLEGTGLVLWGLVGVFGWQSKEKCPPVLLLAPFSERMLILV
eukprot:805836-Ditylum_brightwellii.AAC.1